MSIRDEIYKIICQPDPDGFDSAEAVANLLADRLEKIVGTLEPHRVVHQEYGHIRELRALITELRGQDG